MSTNASLVLANDALVRMNDALVSTNASLVLATGADAGVLRDDFTLVADRASEKNRAAGLFAQSSSGWSSLEVEKPRRSEAFSFTSYYQNTKFGYKTCQISSSWLGCKCL
jgi:hypothetical protein